jgi:ABC-2 type transport system permease protein
MRLVRVELNRFFSRRAVVLLLLAAALLTAFVAGSTIWSSRPVGAEELASAKAQVQEQLAQPDVQDQLRDCRADPQQMLGPDATSADCDRQLAPQAQDYVSRAPLDLGEQVDGSGVPVIVLLTALLIIVGTTFAGSDWSTGSMSNQLLFEPRRLKVWVAKAVAVTLGCLVASAVLLVGFWLALYLVAEARDVSTSGAVLERIGWTTGRGIALATLAGLGGYGLAMLLRSTVAALGLLFAAVVGSEALIAVATFEGAGRWSLTNNVFAWIQDGVGVFDDNIPCPPSSSTCDQLFRLELWQGATYLGVLLLVVLLLSAVSFRRRDVP